MESKAYKTKRYEWLKRWKAIQEHGRKKARELNIKPEDIEQLIEEYRTKNTTKTY